MPEESGVNELGDVWRNQPEEKAQLNIEQFVGRRTRDLSSSTRSEIGISIGSVLFFAAIIALRFASAHDRIQQLEVASGIAAMAWVLVSLYWYRHRIWRKEAPRKDALTAACREYYRSELERRRDHLRNIWLWHGPLFLACAISVAILMGIGKTFPDFERLRSALPLVVLLVVWTGFSIRRRRLQANEVQREIDDIDRP